LEEKEKVISKYNLYLGDNLNVLKKYITDDSIDLAYIDPPFFTGKNQSLLDRTLYDTEGNWLSFKDIWDNHEEYLKWIKLRIIEIHRILKPTGSLYLHCDWHASHLLRVLLDEIFHPKQFRAEIIWYYKRWTNTTRTFQKAHQTIYFYSKTNNYKFNPIYEDYSYTTNIDQIWQKRGRDKNGKCITITKDNGNYIPLSEEKQGVPMRDVWEIPYLNPKSRERTGYPTQKPLELLRRIILTSTNQNDIVLDPVCGSGTTLVAAKALGRKWIGIDSSNDAIKITKMRLSADQNPFEYLNHYTPYKLSRFLKLPRNSKIKSLANIIDMNIVHRNPNIDGFLKKTYKGKPVPIRYIENDNFHEITKNFIRAAEKRFCKIGILILPKTTNKEKNELKNLFKTSINIFITDYEEICKKKFKLEDYIFDRQNKTYFR